MVKTNFSKAYTYTVIVNIRFANGVKEKLCRYTCDINLNPISKIMDKLNATLIDKDGTPTEYTREVINQISGTEYDKEVYDKSEVSFTYLEDIPNVRYRK